MLCLNQKKSSRDPTFPKVVTGTATFCHTDTDFEGAEGRRGATISLHYHQTTCDSSYKRCAGCLFLLLAANMRSRRHGCGRRRHARWICGSAVHLNSFLGRSASTLLSTCCNRMRMSLSFSNVSFSSILGGSHGGWGGARRGGACRGGRCRSGGGVVFQVITPPAATAPAPAAPAATCQNR